MPISLAFVGGLPLTTAGCDVRMDLFVAAFVVEGALPVSSSINPPCSSMDANSSMVKASPASKRSLTSGFGSGTGLTGVAFTFSR